MWGFVGGRNNDNQSQVRMYYFVIVAVLLT
jgi:hypothetical protein